MAPLNVTFPVKVSPKGGDQSLESQVKFPYIHESRNFLETLLVTMNA